jgi:glycosyltransferase involved in cell wall biosynthesis
MNTLGPVFLQMVEFRLYKWSNQVFAATYYLKKLLISRGVDSESIVVIPNGVDISVFNPDVDSSEIRKKYRLGKSLIVLFSGHLEDWAGVDLIYDLAERLNQDVPNSTILLVGSGESTSRLFERLVHANLGHMLTHAGLHPYEEMPKFTALSDVSLCIFPDTPVAHAASPLKLFEYLASGRAVVATRVAGTAEVLDDTTGMLVEPGDIQGICDAVIKLSSNPELRNSLGIRGRKHVEEHYSWDILAEKFLKVCKGVISGI